MQDMFKHEGKVQDNDTYREATQKIKEALKKRENRSAGVFRHGLGAGTGTEEGTGHAGPRIKPDQGPTGEGEEIRD